MVKEFNEKIKGLRIEKRFHYKQVLYTKLKKKTDARLLRFFNGLVDKAESRVLKNISPEAKDIADRVYKHQEKSVSDYVKTILDELEDSKKELEGKVNA